MRPDPDTVEAERCDRLADISDALGLPVSAFYGTADQTEAYLLDLVAAYLRQAKPEARSGFVNAVEALLCVEAQ